MPVAGMEDLRGTIFNIERRIMRTGPKQLVAVALLIAGTLAVVTRALHGTVPTTCQAVGCHGGQPGCYWYDASDSLRIMCYGRR